MGGGSEDGGGRPASKADELRGFVSERLAAASREILAAVERLVAGYEDEASGFRRQIERQRRQLETEPGAKRSRSHEEEEEEEEEGGGGDEEEEEGGGGDEEEALPNLRQPPSRRRFGKRSKRVELKVCVLEDSRTRRLSEHVLQKCPVRKLACPRGLREAAFLRLLTTTFPQLAGDAFDILTCDETRRLRRLKSVTPEEIQKSCTDESTVFIRLKGLKDPDPSEKEDPPEQTHDVAAGGFLSTVTCVRPHASSQKNDGILTSGSTPQPPVMGTEEAEPEAGSQATAQLHAAGGSQPKVKKLPSRPSTETKSNQLLLSCKVCGELHQAEDTLVQHAWSHVNDVRGACGVCGSPSESVEALRDHLQHHGQTEDCGSAETRAHCRARAARKPHVCGVCGKSLSDYRSLSRHRFTHTGERPHSCQACGRRFKLIGALRQHEKTHAKRERSFLCDVCCKMFLTGRQLQIHMRTHSDDKPFRCSECGKGFTTRGPLTVHMRVHTGETPYRCPDCGWCFKRKSNLDDHLTVHSGVKAFVCGICGKACARKTHLTVHMRTHNGERPYQCGACGKAFTQSHCLKTHMRSHREAGAPP